MAIKNRFFQEIFNYLYCVLLEKNFALKALIVFYMDGPHPLNLKTVLGACTCIGADFNWIAE